MLKTYPLLSFTALTLFGILILYALWQYTPAS